MLILLHSCFLLLLFCCVCVCFFFYNLTMLTIMLNGWNIDTSLCQSNSCSIEWGCYASFVITCSVLLVTYDALSKGQKVKVVVRRVFTKSSK